MKILICATPFSFPVKEGIDEQLVSHIRGLTSRGHDVHFVPIARKGSIVSEDELRSEIYPATLFIPPTPGHAFPLMMAMLITNFFGYGHALGSAIRIVCHSFKPDVLHLQGFGLLPILSRVSFPAKVFGLVDYWSLRQHSLAQHGSTLSKISRRCYGMISTWAERRYLPYAKAVHLVSESERNSIAASMPMVRFEAIPIMVEVPLSGAGRTGESFQGFFWGDIRFSHLRAGLLWLLKDVWPLVLDRLPEAKLLALCRRDPDASLLAAAPRGITFIRWCDDVNDLMTQCSVVILPDAGGAGLKNRTLSAFVSGTPVLGTKYALEGFSLIDGVHALLIEDAESTAEKIVALMNSESQRQALAGAAFVLAVRNHSKENVLGAWEILYSDLMENCAIK